MDSAQFIRDNDKLEFRGIVLAHLKRILEISSKELRDCSRVVVSAMRSDFVEQEDTRVSYCQAIDALASVLLPYFDKSMKGKYEEFNKLYELTWYEFMDKHEEELKKHIALLKKVLGTEKDDVSVKIAQIYFLHKQLKAARNCFKELNLLLHRVDYLKSVAYGETEGEDEEEEPDEE